MSEQARWWPDPYGRFEQRYFDGSNWTAHVIGNGVQSVDPLGVSVTVPFVAPATTAPAASVASVASASATSARALQIGDLLDNLGPDAKERPPVKLSIALAGVGGAAAASGIAAAIIGEGVDNRARNIAAAVVVVAAAYAIRFGVKSQAELRSAAVGAGILGIPGLAASTTSDGGGGGTLVLAAVLLIVAWVLPGMRGRPLMLGAGAVAIVLALTTIGDGSSDTTGLFDLSAADFIGGKAWIFVIVAIAFLAMVWWLDAHGYCGVATSLVVAAVLSTALAVFKVVENLGSTGGALLLTIAGLLVAIVGDHGQRRASTWFGVAVAAIGTIAVFTSAFEPNSTAETATTLILSGLLLVVAPAIAKSVRDSRNATPQVDA